MEVLRAFIVVSLMCVVVVLVAPDAAGFVAGAVVLAVLATPFAVVWTLGREFRLPPREVAPDELPGELQDAGRELAALGFDEAGPGIHIGGAAGILMLTRLNRAEKLYADAHKQAHKPVFFEFVTVVAAGASGLSTNNNPETAFAPGVPGLLRQTLPDLGARGLLERHREALRFLAARGIEPGRVAPGEILESVRKSYAAYAEHFRRGRFRFAMTALWRTLRRRSPFLAPLEEQPDIEEQVARMR